MLYFAYGSNLNLHQMLGRCPAAKPLGRFDLDDARLVFCGVADVEYADGESCRVACGRSPRPASASLTSMKASTTVFTARSI